MRPENVKKIFTSLLLILVTTALTAQITVKMDAPSTIVRINTQFVMRIIVNQNANSPKFSLPDGLKLLYNSGAQQQQSFSNINGKMTQSFTKTFTYILVGTKTGKFTIPQATVQAGGQEHKSNSLTIEVIKNEPTSQQQQAQAIEKVFMRLLTNKRTAYIGEQVLVTLKIFYKNTSPIVQLGNYSFPSYTDFWAQEIRYDQPTPKTERVNGQIYQSYVVRDMVLYPLKAGNLEIKPAEIEALIQEQVKGRDPFWGEFTTPRNRQIDLRSNGLTLNINPLPPTATPTDIVGNYDLKAVLDKNELKTNDDLTLTVTISGKGNLKMIEAPEIIFPPEFEVYDPTPEYKTKVTTAGMSGTVTFKYIIIPRNPGNYELSPIELTYFNPQTKQYYTKKSETFQVEVTGEATEGNQAVVQGYTQKDIEQLNQDIHYVKTGKLDAVSPQNTFLGSVWMYILYLLALIGLLYVLLRQRFNFALTGSTEKQAIKESKLAIKRMRNAKKHLKDKEATIFYESMLQSMYGYISNKLSIPVAELSTGVVARMLAEKEVSETTVQQMLDVIERCELSQYAGTNTTDDREEWYHKALEVITQLEKEIK